ncbi:MAG: arsenate reductase (glutaredoxin) [Gordonia sp. (in: high G+C Gram-positive bacteria)]
MGATIYHNPRCSTSRKALGALREAGIEPTVVAYLNEGFTREQLLELFAAAGVTPRQAVRTRERLYKELNLASASEDDLLAAMVAHPILVERPFVVTDKGTRLARPIENIDAIL